MRSLICVLAVSFLCLLGSAAPGRAAVGSSTIEVPAPGAVITDRLSFPVTVSIALFNQARAEGDHFWVSIALGHESLSLQWPKAYVKSAQATIGVSDGGHNPLPTRQPMTVLLLRVDGSRNQQFTRWLEDGLRTEVFPALRVLDREVVARVPIYFPSGAATSRIAIMTPNHAPPMPAVAVPAVAVPAVAVPAVPWASAYTIGLWLAVATLIALVARPHFIPPAQDFLDGWLARGRDWLAYLFHYATCSIASLFSRMLPWTTVQVARVWSAKGYAPLLKEFSVRLVQSAVLVPLFWVALIADARATLTGLSLVFQNDQAHEMVNDDLLVTISPEQTSGDHRSSDTSQPLLELAFQPLVSTWQSAGGPLALGITAIQAAFGVILLWGFSRDEIARLTLRSLFDQRPLFCGCFLALVSAISLLAGFRGYELSPPTLPGLIPASIATLIGFAMPWIMAFALHYVSDSITDVSAPAGAVLGVATVVIGSAAVIAAWTATFLAVMAAASALFVSSLLVRMVIGLLMWLAQLFADVVWSAAHRLAKFRGEHSSFDPASVLVPARVTALVVVMLFGIATSSSAAADPTQAHNAWVFCIDNSRSILPGQFDKMMRALQRIVDQDVTYNDSVWIVLVGVDAQTATLFQMPTRNRRRSDASASDGSLQNAKAAIAGAMARIEQTAMTTDLKVPLELAFELIAGDRRARMKSIIVASDYVQDLPGAKATAQPIALSNLASPRGVHVALLFAQPTAKYLRDLRLSATALFGVVKTDWVGYLTGIGALPTAQMVDGLSN